ncbi:MAG: carboxypeptidase-like regulatory domain-containing protein [Planctomycetota bacterium]|jgi:hypothetical protein|nr:carboxypeptidase-like regulatory domain-containing protein [Planctomycetota bacterium]
MRRGPALVFLLAGVVSLAALAWWMISLESAEPGLVEVGAPGGRGSPAALPASDLPGAHGAGGGRSALSEPTPAVEEAGGPPSAWVPAPPDGPPHAPVSLLLEDGRTGESVPSFSIELWGPGGTRERLSSDASGALTTAAAFPLGPVRVTPRDHPGPRAETGQAVTIQHPGEGGVALVPLALGPTYPLDLDRPPELGALALGARLRRPTDPLWTSAADKLRPVRPGDPEWVRFAHGDVRSGGSPDAWVLEVASPDGRWAGRAQVDAIVGVYPRPVRIELRPRALLRGRASALGEGVSGVSVTLRRADGAGGEWFDRSFKDGSFELRWLEPGLHTLTAVSQRFDPIVREVSVEPGDHNRVELSLAPKAVAGAIGGLLRSRSRSFGRGGKAQGALQRIELRSSEGTGWRNHALVHWSETGEGMIGEFTFPDVPRGAYVVTPQAVGYWSWKPPFLAVEPPATGLEFVLADGGGVCDVALAARDAADGRALAGATVHLWAAGRELSFSDLAPGAVFVEAWPVATEFSWTVEHPGHAPASGSSATLVAEEEAAGCIRTLAVSLEPGWGATFVTLALDDLDVERPLAGVELLLDGEPCGVTDARGELSVRAPRPPSGAVFSLAGWRLLDGDLAPDGAPTPRRARITARFTRLR